MTLSDLQGHSLLQALPNAIFLYSCAAVDKILIPVKDDIVAEN